MIEVNSEKRDSYVYTYIVVSGVLIEGSLSTIKRKFRVVSFESPRKSHEVISYLEKSGWFSEGRSEVKWVEVYRANLMGGRKVEGSQSLETLFNLDTEVERLGLNSLG